MMRKTSVGSGTSRPVVGASSTTVPRRVRDDSGFSLVEIIVAVVVLSIVSLPTALVVINTQRTAAYNHLKAEAQDLASQYLENQIQFANSPAFAATPGAEVTTTTIGDTVFTVTGAVTIQTNSAGSVTACQAPAGSGQIQQLYVVTANVTWHGLAGGGGTYGGPVSLSTEIAPASASSSTTTGEIAVPIENLDTTPDTTDKVWAEVTGAWTQSGSEPTVGAGEVLSEYSSDTTATGASGCIVFTGLDPTAGFSYSVTIAYCGVGSNPSNECTAISPELVDFDENGAQVSTADPTAPGLPTTSGLTVSAGGVTVSPAFYLAEAATVPVKFATYEYPSGGGAPTLESSTTYWEPSYVRIGVQNGLLQCDTTDTTCLLGNGSNYVATSGTTDLYLYPYSDGYESVFAGDEAESNPLAESTAATPVSYYVNGSFTESSTVTPPLPVSTSSVADTTETALTIPLYAAQFSVNCSSLTSGHTFTGLGFTEVDGAGATYIDTPASLTCSGSTKATIDVGLPLGQYLLSSQGSGSTVQSSGDEYVWVTPFGVCASATLIPASDAPITNCASSVGTWTTSTVSVVVK